MPHSYSPPGATAYPMISGLPGNYNGIEIKGSEQFYITDNFGQTVIQTVSTENTSFSLHSMTWHHLQEVWRHIDYGPGLFVHLVKSDSSFIEVGIKGIGGVDLKYDEYVSFIGDGITWSYKPKATGTCTGILCWFSEGFLKELPYKYPQLQFSIRSIIPDFAEKVIGPTLCATGQINAVIDEILNENYTGDHDKRSFRRKMKKLARLGLEEFMTLTEEQKKLSLTTRKKIKGAIRKLGTKRCRNMTPEDLSKEVGLGVTTLKKGIKAFTGMGLKDYQKELMFTKIVRRVMLKGERIKDVFADSGYTTPESLGKAFKTRYWCNITELKSRKWRPRSRNNYVISEEDRIKYGALLARYMSGKLVKGELEEINRWLLSNDEHLQVFEKLTDDKHSEWTKDWFKAGGINYDEIEWKEDGGWERPDPELKRDQKNLIWYFLVSLLIFGLFKLELVYGVNGIKGFIKDFFKWCGIG